MSPRGGIVGSVIAGVMLATSLSILINFNRPSPTPVATAPALATTSIAVATSTEVAVATTTGATTTATTTPKKTKVPIVSASAKAVPTSSQSQTATASASNEASSDDAVRIQSPYPTPPEDSSVVNDAAHAAVVNILCKSNGSVKPISGSGVIIDPRGVILTNAHVAQYILLSEDPAINLQCDVRTGSPARDEWTASVLYLPPVWVAAHADELNTEEPKGTGEHDYALLLIDSAVPGGTLPAQFPYLPFDTRQAIGFTGDQVLVASYPAEFLGGLQAENGLYAASSLTTIGDLLTFGENSVDVLSLGGVIEAQGGSSGGAVVNPWGRLIGIITTTSSGATTADRDLRAITLSYIDTDLKAQTGLDLNATLAGDLQQEQKTFDANLAPQMLQQYITRIEQSTQ